MPMFPSEKSDVSTGEKHKNFPSSSNQFKFSDTYSSNSGSDDWIVQLLNGANHNSPSAHPRNLQMSGEAHSSDSEKDVTKHSFSSYRKEPSSSFLHPGDLRNNPVKEQFNRKSSDNRTPPRIVPVQEARLQQNEEPLQSWLNANKQQQEKTLQQRQQRQDSSTVISSSTKCSSTCSTTMPHPYSKHLDRQLHCLPATNVTQYDHLVGIRQRDQFLSFPEPELILYFRKHFPSLVNSDQLREEDLIQLEKKLMNKKRKQPKSPQVYNRMGNLLRLYGDSRGAVECFRWALHFSPAHADSLLNMARILFHHRYLQDALYLVKRALQYEESMKNPWFIHFALAEILKELGDLQEAEHHFRLTTNFNPEFYPARVQLQEVIQMQSVTSWLEEETFWLVWISLGVFFLCIWIFGFQMHAGSLENFLIQLGTSYTTGHSEETSPSSPVYRQASPSHSTHENGKSSRNSNRCSSSKPIRPRVTCHKNTRNKKATSS